MDFAIDFNKAAFGHKVSNANLIEVLYNVIDVDKIMVFHAMRCRSQFIQLLKDRRKR